MSNCVVSRNLFNDTKVISSCIANQLTFSSV